MGQFKLKLLKIVLGLGAIYYLVGAFAHFFAVTLFPFFDARLYAPYQDSLIALCALIFAALLVTVARDPDKNSDVLKLIIAGASVASVFSIAIIWRIDFAALGAPDKELQTIVEGLLGFGFVGALLLLYPRKQG
ncbi:MAG: hypothetical protein A2855_02515 [Candidatus Liptonbacteria bacterium RIFCSPHIGHO2_01_FULL_57_28]|uniref:Uncharacterized protein n=1 Tax=Candidatus Liptonbacteria bacterium RIFCSPHIGHO2_01_FULL_57_28 TaxID=1798647 RepID=A0A1G2CA06_9BACT|nr:MAG: hypothetical protein A2855_02515 [Candidatus Liptonbacteria bacterium RIFCSPHIGHO2_01_FULL_57_28]